MQKMRWEMSPVIWRPFSLGLNGLTSEENGRHLEGDILQIFSEN